MSHATSRTGSGSNRFMRPDGDYVVPRGTLLPHRLRRVDVPPASGPRALREARARIHPQFRLANDAGELLHGSVKQGALLFVTTPAYAWMGDATTLVRLCKRFPETRTLKAVPVLKDTGAPHNIRSL